MHGRTAVGPRIYVCDADPEAAGALMRALARHGFEPEILSLDRLTERAGHAAAPIIIDLPAVDGEAIGLLKRLAPGRYPAPIFAVSGGADIPTAVAAIKLGVADFFEKPFDAERVALQIREEVGVRARTERDPLARFPGAERLTLREREVLRHITAGASNKEAGRTLGISPRTIEVHRARIMEKLGARNAADLVRLVLGGG